MLAWGLRRVVVASLGVEAIAEFAKGGKKPSSYTDTGVARITDQPQDGMSCKDTKYASMSTWG